MALRLHGAMRSDVGLVRSGNEDCVAFVTGPRDGAGGFDEGLLLLADGMGGHKAGEVASALAVEVIRARFPLLSGTPLERLAGAFAEANAAIHAQGSQSGERSGMGTTCVAVALAEGQAFYAHVGDSRLYFWRDGQLRRVTEDQTLVASLVRAGELTEAEAEASPQANVLLQAMGTRAEIEPELGTLGPFRPGDALLLCSDGLTGCASEDDIAAILADGGDPDSLCEGLIAAALAGGGHDNVSVGVFVARESAGEAIGDDRKTTRRIPLPALDSEG